MIIVSLIYKNFMEYLTDDKIIQHLIIKDDKFQTVIEQMQQLPNVVVRLSSDGVQGEIVPDAPNSSTIIPTISHKLDNMTLCRAYERDGKCGTCRACWDKTISVVAYPAHGAKMLQQIKNLIQTVEVV